MKKEKNVGEWILFYIKNNKIIAQDTDFMKIFEKSQKYPVDKVIIEQRLKKGTCFF